MQSQSTIPINPPSESFLPTSQPTLDGDLKSCRSPQLTLLILFLSALTVPLFFLPIPEHRIPLPSHPRYLTSRITIGIKTYACDSTAPFLIATVLRAIRNSYPFITVLIANDGPLALGSLEFIRNDPYTKEIHLPLDVGISAGRNAMVKQTSTPFFLLLDDDYLFDPYTNLALLNNIDNFDIVGIRIRNLPGIQELEDNSIFVPRYVANITRFENRVVELCVWDENAGPGVYGMRVPINVDVVHNAFIARVEALRRVPWREELKVNEHMTFFLDAKKAGLKVGYLPSVYVHHRQRESSKCYERMRRREPEFEKLLEYRDSFKWTKRCYKSFPKYVKWHISMEKGQFVS